MDFKLTECQKKKKKNEKRSELLKVVCCIIYIYFFFQCCTGRSECVEEFCYKVISTTGYIKLGGTVCVFFSGKM